MLRTPAPLIGALGILKDTSMRFIVTIALACFSVSAFSANSYIEFGQFDKVKRASIAAGALYACSKDESIDWKKRNAYQFMHFKVEQVVDDYFKVAYRVTAIQDMSLADRIKIVDEHKKIEAQRDALQKIGFDAVGKSMKCEDAGSFAAEILKYQ